MRGFSARSRSYARVMINTVITGSRAALRRRGIDSSMNDDCRPIIDISSAMAIRRIAHHGGDFAHRLGRQLGRVCHGMSWLSWSSPRLELAR